MTVQTATVAPEYVSFYVTGSLEADIPIGNGRAGVFGTDECLVVTCLYWNDGDTTITLGSFGELPAQSMPLRFDGVLETPSRRLLLYDVHMPEILATDVSDTRTRVRIWSNHETQPDEVVIALE